MTGLYNADGQRQVTTVSGSSYTGLYAVDGSYNGVLNDGVTTIAGMYHPCGALNVCIVTDNSAMRYARNGSLNVIASINGYGLIGGPPTSIPPLTTGILAANRTITPGSITVTTAPITYYTQHWSSPQGAISNLQFVDVGWYYFDNGTTIPETNIGGTYTFDRWVEYPTSTFTQVQSAVTVTDGGINKSTPFAGLTIPANTPFGVRTVITAVTGAGVIPTHAIPAAPSVLGLLEGSQAGSFGNSGTVPVSASTSDTFHPCAILGNVAKANAKAFVIVGDSITAVGQGDSLSTGPAGGNGWQARILDPVCSYTRIGRQSIAATDLATTNTRLATLISTLGSGYTNVGINLGINDFNTRYARTAAQCSTDCGTIMNLFPNTGVTKYQSTLGGSSTSTDGFQTAGNQTANATQLAQIPTFNPSIRAIPAYLNGGFVVEWGNTVVPTTDNCKWRTPYVMTADGTHPTSYGHKWGANQLCTVLGGTYLAEAETTAFFNANLANGNPNPIATWRDNYNSLVFMAKQNGWWAQQSCIYNLNSYDRGVSKQNLKRNGDHLVESGTVSWVTKSGFNSSGTGKLTSTYNPTTALDGLWTQNSATFKLGITNNTTTTNGATDIAIWTGAAGSFFTARNGSNVAQGRVNTSANQATAATVTDGSGDWAFTRVGATSTNIDRNAVNIVNNANASIVVPSATLELGGLGALFTSNNYRYATVGAGMSIAQIGVMEYDLNCFNNVAQGL